MKRLGYREAIDWIACNDDTYWTADLDPIPSVTAVMVAHLFGVDVDKVRVDIAKMVDRLEKMAERLDKERKKSPE
jgi:hypothetical protein